MRYVQLSQMSCLFTPDYGYLLTSSNLGILGKFTLNCCILNISSVMCTVLWEEDTDTGPYGVGDPQRGIRFIKVLCKTYFVSQSILLSFGLSFSLVFCFYFLIYCSLSLQSLSLAFAISLCFSLFSGIDMDFLYLSKHCALPRCCFVGRILGESGVS